MSQSPPTRHLLTVALALPAPRRRVQRRRVAPAEPLDPSRRPGRGRLPGRLPESQPEPLPAGETRTVTITTDQGDIEIKIDGGPVARSPPATSSRSPSAAGTTASCSTASCPAS